MISVIIHFSASESCLILAKMSSKQVNSPSFINALNISSWTFNVLTSTAKKMGGLKPPQPHPLGGPWTVNQACRGTLALKDALILQSSQLPLPNHVFYAFCNANNEGVNPRRKSWGSLRFFYAFCASRSLVTSSSVTRPQGFLSYSHGHLETRTLHRVCYWALLKWWIRRKFRNTSLACLPLYFMRSK